MMDRILQEPYEFINKQAEQIDRLKEQNVQYEFALKLLVDELNALKGECEDILCADCGNPILECTCEDVGCFFCSDPDCYNECLESLHKQPPCINCGQTEGEVYQGQPHDHVCPDCGREIPYNPEEGRCYKS